MSHAPTTNAVVEAVNTRSTTIRSNNVHWQQNRIGNIIFIRDDESTFVLAKTMWLSPVLIWI